MHFMHIRMRVRPFPLSAREDFLDLQVRRKMEITPAAGVVAVLIDNF
jgi:hypothetical protein